MYSTFGNGPDGGSRFMKRLVVIDLHLQSNFHGEPRLSFNLGVKCIR